MFEKNMRLPLLLDCYGEILGSHRREIFEMYYCEDLSLAEISENTGISRQGVRDSIKKSEAQLHDLEDKLHLLERIERLQTSCDREAQNLESILKDVSDPTLQDSIRNTVVFLKAISL